MKFENFILKNPDEYLSIFLALFAWLLFIIIATVNKKKDKIYEYFASRFRKDSYIEKLKKKDKEIKELEKFYKENEEKIEEFNIQNCLNHRLFSFIDTFLAQTLHTLTTDTLMQQAYFPEAEKIKRTWNVKKLAEINLTVYEKHLRKFINDIIKKDKELTVQNFEKMLITAFEEFVNNCDKEKVNSKFLEVFYQSHHENDKRNMFDCENIILHYDELSKSAKLHKILDIYYATIATNINNINVISEINGRVTEALLNWEIPDKGE